MTKKYIINGITVSLIVVSLSLPQAHAEELQKVSILDKIAIKFHDIKNDIAAFQFFNKHCESVNQVADKTKAESRQCYTRLTKEMRARKALHQQVTIN